MHTLYLRSLRSSKYFLLKQLFRPTLQLPNLRASSLYLLKCTRYAHPLFKVLIRSSKYFSVSIPQYFWTQNTSTTIKTFQHKPFLSYGSSFILRCSLQLKYRENKKRVWSGVKNTQIWLKLGMLAQGDRQQLLGNQRKN